MYNMTDAEIKRASTLIEDEDLAAFEQIKLGLWAVVSERGLYGVYDKKAVAIDTVLSEHSQSRNFCKIKRCNKGIYDLSILDCDESPTEHFYHDFRLERITSNNISWIRELALTALLPAWFFDPYSEEYKEYHRTVNQ